MRMFLALPLLAFQMTAFLNLDSLRWHYRVVVIFASEGNDRRIQEQNQIVDSHSHGFAERDIKVFRVIGGKPAAEGLREKLRTAEKGFAIVLIGKDGTVKLRKTDPLSAEELFRTIDKMPMRKDEMRQRQ